MSGLDEREKLWILEYKEWYGEDWIHCFRGLYAMSFNDAKRKADIWLKYCNYNYGENEDGEDDYVYEGIFAPEKHVSHTFLLNNEVLDSMHVDNEAYERELESED